MEDVNKKCGNIHCYSYSTESACSSRGVNTPACLVQNSEPRLNRTPRHITTGWVCPQDILTLCQCVINRTRQFTVRDLSCCIAHIDSINDCNGFSSLSAPHVPDLPANCPTLHWERDGGKESRGRVLSVNLESVCVCLIITRLTNVCLRGVCKCVRVS